MYGSIVTFQIRSGREDEAVRIYQDSLAPLVKEQGGFQHSYFLMDRTTRKATIVGLWETEASARGFETSGRNQQAVDMMAEVLDGPVTRKVYEISAQF